MNRHRLLVILFTAFRVSLCLSQQVSGEIIDMNTGKGIEAANIFFANYQVGTFSEDSGKFLLKCPGRGKLQLIITHVAYYTVTEDIELKENDSLAYKLIKLTPRKVSLEEVEISAREDKSWKRNYKIFSNAFIGSNTNSKLCKILNPYDINFEKKDGILSASANNLIEINNNATGYKILFLLEHFQVDSDNKVIYSGKPYFEELPVEELNTGLYYDKNRIVTYRGSLRHFIYAAINNNLKEEGFFAEEGNITQTGNFSAIKKAKGKDLIKYDSLNDNIYLTLNTKWLRISYKGEMENYTSGTRGENSILNSAYSGSSQVSFLHALKPKILVLPNGVIMDAGSLHEYGYWSTERVSDLMPYDYIPK